MTIADLTINRKYHLEHGQIGIYVGYFQSRLDTYICFRDVNANNIYRYLLIGDKVNNLIKPV